MEAVKKKKEVVILVNGNMTHSDDYIKEFKKIPNIPDVRVMCISSLRDVTDDILFVSIISDIHNLETDESMKLSSLCFYNQLFAISTDDNDYLNNFYKDETQYGKVRTTSFEEMLNLVKFEFNPKDIVIGFISDDEKNMKELFYKLYNDAVRYNCQDIIDSYRLTVPKGTPIKYLPTIFQGWIQSVWYGKKEEEIKDHYATNVICEICADPGKATIAGIITVKFKFGQSITYVWIYPGIDTDLLNIDMKFHAVYVDINSNYNTLILPEVSKEFDLIPVTLYDINDCKYSEKDYMNAMHNLYKLISYEVVDNDTHTILINRDISKSIFAYDKSFAAQKFYHITSINPYYYLEVE